MLGRLQTAMIVISGIASFGAQGGYFDCSVIYDEYEHLMANRFLVEPDRYVSTLANQITRNQYEKFQKKLFKLQADRNERGIAVFRTNGNLYGKLLFHWSAPLEDQQPHLLIENAVLYGRVVDGYAPMLLPPIRLKPGATLDLDTGIKETSAEDGPASGVPPHQLADLKYEIGDDDGEPRIRAVNNAQMQFPVESMCHQPKRR